MIIKVINEEKRFVDKCIKYKISIKNIVKYQDYMLVTIDDGDYDNICHLCYFSDITIYKYLGFKGLLKFIKKYSFDLGMLILFILNIFFISNVIVDIDINHENVKLKEYISKLIDGYGVSKYKLRMSDSKLNKISDEILKNNRDKLDFISIERVGMKYIVSIEERIIKNPEVENNTCHVIATKSGVIKYINAESGIEVVESGSFVHKGDILISGEIKLNDEVKNNVCASGIVLADVWYKIKVTMPKVGKKKEYTGKSRYNFKYKDKFLYKDSYKNYDEKCLFKFFNFRIYKEKEYTYKTFNKEHDKLISESIEIAKNSILEKIGKNNKVIEEKVLKDEENNSTIEVDIFINVEEDIGSIEYYKVGEVIDTR